MRKLKTNTIYLSSHSGISSQLISSLNTEQSLTRMSTLAELRLCICIAYVSIWHTLNLQHEHKSEAHAAYADCCFVFSCIHCVSADRPVPSIALHSRTLIGGTAWETISLNLKVDSSSVRFIAPDTSHLLRAISVGVANSAEELSTSRSRIHAADTCWRFDISITNTSDDTSL